MEAADGEEYVFPGVAADSNLRTTLLRIISRAGIEPWPKLFQNLRASGATDFARAMPSHVAAAICGHTEQIAMEHYRMATDYDMDEAVRKVGALNVHEGAFSGQKEAQNTAQQSSANQGQNTAKEQENSGEISVLPYVSHVLGVGEERFELPTSTL